MPFSPDFLLSKFSREKCVANLKELPNFIYNEDNRKTTAAVLVSLCVNEGEVCLLYTLRSLNLTSHSGQVSFPGGKVDNNETEIETALRETQEEIGVDPKNVDIWGKMPCVQGRDRNIIITPVIGLIKNFDMNKLEPSEFEVEEIFCAPIATLCNPDIHGHLEFENMVTPVYLYGKFKIWGLTGLITHLFLQCFLPENVYTFDFTRNLFSIDQLMPSKL